MEYIVIAIFVVVIALFFIQGWRNSKLRSSTPATLTTIGVLGTFVGIFIGLWDFNVEDPQKIRESIPPLLGGLKIAFATSIAGMFAGLVFKILSARGSFGEEASQGDVGPGEIHSVLVGIQNATQEQKTALSDLRKSIAGDSDDTLLTQLKNLRTEMNDNSKKLIFEFQEFAQKMAEDNSQALIEALENVMRDFNAKINEQFGDNFKQLNEAVGKLVDWQENYRQQMDNLEEQIKRVIGDLGRSAESLTQIVDKTTALPETLESLGPLLEDARDKTTKLEATLTAIASLGDKAQNTFPIIENNLKSMTEGMAAAVNEAINTSKDAVVDQTKFAKQLLEAIKNNQNALDGEIERALRTAIQELGNRLVVLAEALAGQYDKVNQAVDSLTQAIDRFNGRQ